MMLASAKPAFALTNETLIALSHLLAARHGPGTIGAYGYGFAVPDAGACGCACCDELPAPPRIALKLGLSAPFCPVPVVTLGCPGGTVPGGASPGPGCCIPPMPVLFSTTHSSPCL